MSPRSPQFKQILWRAFSCGSLAGVTIRNDRINSHYYSYRFYFRSGEAARRFRARIAPFGTLPRDCRAETEYGHSGLLFVVVIPAMISRPIRHRDQLAFPARGGLRQIMAMHEELQAL